MNVTCMQRSIIFKYDGTTCFRFTKFKKKTDMSDDIYILIFRVIWQKRRYIQQFGKWKKCLLKHYFKLCMYIMDTFLGKCTITN